MYCMPEPTQGKKCQTIIQGVSYCFYATPPLLCRGRLRTLPVEGCIFSLRSLLSLSSKTRARQGQFLLFEATDIRPERHTQNIETKLWELQTESLKLVLRLGPQRMRSCRPKVGHRRTNRGVVQGGVGVNVARILDFALDRGADAMDLGRGQRLEGGNAPFLRQSVDSRVLEELGARVVDGGD